MHFALSVLVAIGVVLTLFGMAYLAACAGAQRQRWLTFREWLGDQKISRADALMYPCAACFVGWLLTGNDLLAGIGITLALIYGALHT
jgi:ABC-type nickel/cobalt efflux system permease component RcnA